MTKRPATVWIVERQYAGRKTWELYVARRSWKAAHLARQSLFPSGWKVNQVRIRKYVEAE